MATEKQKELASFIKGVHQNLRLQSRACGDDQAWLLHCQKTDMLEKYAESMQLLATQFWEKTNNNEKNTCRIQWVHKQCMEFFFNGGQEKAILKENRMSQLYFAKPLNPIDIPIETYPIMKLLDVGSCYNPFSKFSIFKVTALDITPATSDVFKCDFLSVEISEDVKHVKNPCNVLPAKYYDIVVFSLFLEYFPSPKQRFRCCKKAYELLKPAGILFILTPDSKHATANSKLMKSWKYALTSLGLWRVCYEKVKHLHCMAYYKCVDPNVPQSWLSAQHHEGQPEVMLCIPQDFTHYCDTLNNKELDSERCDADNKMLADVFSNMPDCDIFYD